MGIFNFLKRNKRKPLHSNTEIDIKKIKIVLPEPEPRIYAETAIMVPQSKGELNGVTQNIWTYAPDEYDQAYCYHPPCSSLDSDFDELRQGINIVFRQKRFNDRRPVLLNLVEEAYLAYSRGDRNKGMKLIEQIQAMTGKMK